MYSTCAFCGGPFAGNGEPSGLGVGRRLAFDSGRGRLWVVCGKCARWNLAPLEERWEAIEVLEREAATGRLRAHTSQISLIALERLELVRVGRPPLLESAVWRIGEHARVRRFERLMYSLAGAGVGIAATAALAMLIGGTGSPALVTTGMRLGNDLYVSKVGKQRLALEEAPLCDRCGRVLSLTAKDMEIARLQRDSQGELGLLVSCPHCLANVTLLTGDEAAASFRKGLTFLRLADEKKHPTTFRGARTRFVSDAVSLVERAGGTDRFLTKTVRDEPLLSNLSPIQRGALEIAFEERDTALELERQWWEAEEIAEIADGTLSTSAQLEEELRRLKRRQDNQPFG